MPLTIHAPSRPRVHVPDDPMGESVTDVTDVTEDPTGDSVGLPLRDERVGVYGVSSDAIDACRRTYALMSSCSSGPRTWWRNGRLSTGWPMSRPCVGRSGYEELRYVKPMPVAPSTGCGARGR